MAGPSAVFSSVRRKALNPAGTRPEARLVRRRTVDRRRHGQAGFRRGRTGRRQGGARPLAPHWVSTAAVVELDLKAKAIPTPTSARAAAAPT